MKTKTLLIILVVVGMLFLYFSVCYRFVNQTIKKATEEVALEYALEHYSIDSTVTYMTSQVYQDNVISVYYQINSDNKEYYLHFFFEKRGSQYYLLDASEEVPHYITLLYS